MKQFDCTPLVREIDGISIELRRSADYYAAAMALSEYIKLLPLTVEQNDRLVDLIIEQVIAAEASGQRLYGRARGCTANNHPFA